MQPTLDALKSEAVGGNMSVGR